MKADSDAKAKALEAAKAKLKSGAEMTDKEKKQIYLSELAQKYPQGKTTLYEEGTNFKVVRIILVNGGDADEYKKITYNWGGVFFKK